MIHPVVIRCAAIRLRFVSMDSTTAIKHDMGGGEGQYTALLA